VTHKVGLLPYATKPGLRLSKIRLDALDWPLEPGAAHPGCVGDLGPDDHLIVPPNSQTLYLPHFGVRCKISTWIVEPRSVHARHFFWLRLFHRRFHRIFTYNADFLKRVPNARFSMSGWTWLRNPEAPPAEKTKMTSLIASKKKDLAGHKLRHEIAAWVQESGADVDLLGRGYLEFGDKEEGLAPYRFSVVIENSAEPGYMSEKLLDCLICQTVPLYWGAPDAGGFFDLNGIIVCNSFEDIVREIGGLSDARYRAMAGAVSRNRATALRHAHFDRNAANALIEEDRIKRGP
jgi:Glycosyltransferase family 10 (fucosyltransferase) C-term